MGNFIVFMKEVSCELQNRGSFGTAHVYRSSLNVFTKFLGSESLPFNKMLPELLKRFETHLRGRGCSWNTVSTYMRTLRATYNRAVEQQQAPYVPNLFRYVYTGTRADHQRALETEDISRLIAAHQLSAALKRVQALFFLMFLMRGLPFVDLVYLKKSDLRGNIITYRRRKTGRSLSVTLTDEAFILLEKYRNRNDDSPYLFPFLVSSEGTKEAYREYQLALRSFNHQLMLLKKILGIKGVLSSYAARHTWATMAYYCEIHPGIISEAMGHSSITITETYLKPFHSKKIDEANLKVISFMKQSVNAEISA